jgi:hypothetical protein
VGVRRPQTPRAVAASRTLLCGFPLLFSEETVREAFRGAGFIVERLKPYSSTSSMLLIELASVDDAVMAIVQMNNLELAEGDYLFMSLSRF